MAASHTRLLVLSENVQGGVHVLLVLPNVVATGGGATSYMEFLMGASTLKAFLITGLP